MRKSRTFTLVASMCTMVLALVIAVSVLDVFALGGLSDSEFPIYIESGGNDLAEIVGIYTEEAIVARASVLTPLSQGLLPDGVLVSAERHIRRLMRDLFKSFTSIPPKVLHVTVIRACNNEVPCHG